jgi:hypothetical protein
MPRDNDHLCVGRPASLASLRMSRPPMSFIIKSVTTTSKLPAASPLCPLIAAAGNDTTSIALPLESLRHRSGMRDVVIDHQHTGWPDVGSSSSAPTACRQMLLSMTSQYEGMAREVVQGHRVKHDWQKAYTPARHTRWGASIHFFPGSTPRLGSAERGAGNQMATFVPRPGALSTSIVPP